MLPTYVLHSLYERLSRVQSFILFSKSWRDSAVLIFSGRISLSFVLIFVTASLPNIHYVVIFLCMQLFFLKSYEWSLNLKISVIISGATLLFTLNISVDSIWIFLSWIVTELSHSRSSRKEELCYINTFMQLVYSILYLSSMSMKLTYRLFL